ncbi:MAG: hypothetical protein ACRD0W_00545 [Acidimicrobiales bacterium]
MVDRVGHYSFLPWLRRGIANQIITADLDPAVPARASTHVHLRVTGDALAGGTVSADIERNLELYGPGDVVGIDPRAIVRTEPRNWITDFEPNYLALVECYDEDFFWRYTPAAPAAATRRLRPWLALAVLKEDEFEDAGQLPGKPLPSISVPDLDVFPPADELWAWAHVHVNRSLAGSPTEVVSDDMGVVLPRFQAVLAENPDLACSRLICPRQLDPNEAYHAFLLPTFETGRLAGLGLDPADAPHATHSSWAPYASGSRAEPDRFPCYHRWFFRTGTVGDFEYLVRLLRPRPVDSRVGARDMDVQDPGANLPGITDAQLRGVLRLGGALRVPEESLTEEERTEAQVYEDWDQPSPHPFQRAFATLVNLADDYTRNSAEAANADTGLGPAVEDDPDPLITPPLYGRWHALTARLLTTPDGTPQDPDDNWVHELNLDPRFRVPAGFGTDVVQQRQEEYMAAAWDQIGDVLEANRRIRAAQLAREVALSWHTLHVQPLLQAEPERAVLLTAPVQSRVMAERVTMAHRVATSRLSTAPLSAAMRRAARPGSRLMRALPWDANISPGTLLTRIDAGDVAAAPPKMAPPAVTTVDEVASELEPRGLPLWLRRALERWPWLLFLPLVIALVLLLVLLATGAGPSWWILGVVVVAVAVAAWRLLDRWYVALRRAARLREGNQTPEAVDDLPRSPDFVLSEPGSGVRPRTGTSDSPEATRFKGALRNLSSTLGASAEAAYQEPRLPLGVVTTGEVMVAAIDPQVTVSRRVLLGIRLPERLRTLVAEEFKEAMAYPVIDVPTYRPLVELSSELFLPNINLIEQNSITLLETNQRFIEAYMVGLNHEMARELLWREYPTDQRGSYFRQFWDVSTFLGAAGEDPEALRERLRDIPPLHRWAQRSALGEHDNREVGGAVEEEVVLVIRGELLKKYPTAVIYAHRADWQRKADGSIDNTKERRPIVLTEAEEADPPRTKVKTPLYEAKVDPDIYFFGFDLTAEAARGESGEQPDDDPGWFFVVKERPGEPRFGFDISREGDLNVWNDLAWPDVLAAADADYVTMGAGAPTHSLVEPTDPAVQEKVVQWQDDRALLWAPATMNASDVAYIAYQAPVLVAVHAAEMLGEGSTT